MVRRKKIIIAIVILYLAIVPGAVESPAAVPEGAIALTREAIAESPDSLAAFEAGLVSDVDTAVAEVWKARNPLIYRYYFGHLAGERRYTATHAYFDRWSRIPDLFKLNSDPWPDQTLDGAVAFARALVEQLPGDALVFCALGYTLLERGTYEEADDAFLEALKIDRKLAEARNGRGLAITRQSKQGARGMGLIQEAFTMDPDYADAVYSLGISHIALRTLDIGRWFEEVVKRRPDHPDAWFKLGAFHEAGLIIEKDPNLIKAAEAYQKQVDVNLDHGKAWFQLGSVLLQSGSPGEAISMWERLMEERPSFRQDYLPLLLEAYQKSGFARKAETVADDYIAGLDEDVRGLFKNLSLIATPEERTEYEALDRFDRLIFARKFWQKRDPTPATQENERRIEHYRRVIYAIQNYSDAKDPWDRRGEVYIRYGEPRHKSRSDNVRFEFTGDVVQTKERLLRGLPTSARREIIELITSWRASSQDINEERGDAFDFQGIDFELNQTRSQDNVFGARNTDQTRLSATPATMRDRQEVETIRGFPLFPIEGSRPWEYWIYPQVNGGIEVVFQAISVGAPFEYPIPPQGRGRGNDLLWVQRSPESVVASATKDQADLFKDEQATLDLWLDQADFLADGKRTRLELYFAVPMDNLVPVLVDTGRLQRGLAVFDTTWRVKYQEVDTIRYVKSEMASGFVISQSAIELPPGEYILGSQFRDMGSGGYGSKFKRVSVEPYVLGQFSMSDIEVATEIFEDYDEVLKSGLGVIPNPTHIFSAEKSMHVYYEVYNLTKNEFGQTLYRVTYQVEPLEEKRKFFGKVLRSIGKVVKEERKETVMISTEQTGYREDQNEFLELDVSKSEPGEFRLTLTIVDLVADQTISKLTNFRVVTQ